MSTKPSPPPAQPVTDGDFLDTFPWRLRALAGLLNAVAESGLETTQSVFAPSTLRYLSELAADLAMGCTRWVTTHEQDEKRGEV